MTKRLGMAIAAFSAVPILVCGQDVVVDVNASRTAAYKIPRTIYGTFLEPIGNSTYGGLWAQILENPSLEDNLWNASQLRSKLEANPGFYRSSELGLPLPWEPLDAAQGTRYEPRWNDAANSYRSLFLMALPEAETGIRQAVYLPLHRTLEYRGSLFVKHVTGPGQVEVSLRQRNRREVVYSTATVDTGDDTWTKREFTLALKPNSVAALEPLDFVVSVNGGERVLVDQISLWPADAVQGMDPEMIDLSKALRTPIVRFGGNYTSAYHWRDGIGPLDKRVSMLNLAWGMPEYNQFGTDEFLQFCRLIGAEPQVALNLGTGTPAEAADWVKYINEKWNSGGGGLIWELGNELWGDFQTGYPTIARIADLTKEFAAAIRAIDPKAILIATGQDPDHFEPWNARQLENAKLIDYLSTHFVVGSGEVKAQRPDADFVARAAFALPVGLERRLRAMRDQIKENPEAGDRIGIAFTEWLFWARDDRSPRFTNMAGAVCTAGMLNTLLRTADFTRISDMTGLIEFGGIWKKRGRVFGVPAYWAFRMYSNADATTPVDVRTAGPTYDVREGSNRLPDIPSVPYLDIVAARNDSGDRLTLFCVNRHLTRDLRANITLHDFSAGSGVRVETLTSESIYNVNNELEPDAVRPVETWERTNKGLLTHIFPHASVTIVEFRR
jgi:alpha-L-arabinofuranosidase